MQAVGNNNGDNLPKIGSTVDSDHRLMVYPLSVPLRPQAGGPKSALRSLLRSMKPAYLKHPLKRSRTRADLADDDVPRAYRAVYTQIGGGKELVAINS